MMAPSFKVIISPTPLVGPDDAAVEVKGGLVVLICGDRHWQYHSIHPNRFHEFSCGALTEANAREGRTPSDPDSTDPDGLIVQPYLQTKRSGGFVKVAVHPRTDSIDT